jgi:hypothetical protein
MGPALFSKGTTKLLTYRKGPVSKTDDGDGNDISVLQVSNRLQITADVDLVGLDKLKKMLEMYEAILKLTG